MSATAVKIWNGVVGHASGEREAVWIVSVHCADGSDAIGHEWDIYDDQDAAEDGAAARDALLGLHVIDERDTRLANIVPFVCPGK